MLQGNGRIGYWAARTVMHNAFQGGLGECRAGDEEDETGDKQPARKHDLKSLPKLISVPNGQEVRKSHSLAHQFSTALPPPPRPRGNFLGLGKTVGIPFAAQLGVKHTFLMRKTPPSQRGR